MLRGANKADAGKELETQKEVVVSMLLRLIQYHQVGGRYGGVVPGRGRERGNSTGTWDSLVARGAVGL